MALLGRTLIAIACIWLLAIVQHVSSQTCYSHKGTPLPNVDQAVCPGTNICCALLRPGLPGDDYENGDRPTRDECLPNGLCRNRYNDEGREFTSYWRNFCTDKNWNEGCLKGVCMNMTGPDAFDGHKMTPCDGTATSEKWCCGDSNKCCLQGRDDFVLLAQTLGEPVPTSSANSDMNSATESSSITGSIPASSSTNTAAPESPRNGGLSTGAKAGIGVGAAVGALTLLAGGFFIAKALQWKKKAARAKEINNMGYAGEEQPIQYNSPYSDWQHTAIVQDQKVELNAAPDTHELPDHERRH